MTTSDLSTRLDPDSKGWRRHIPSTPWFAAIAIAFAIALGAIGGAAQNLPWWAGTVGNLAALWLFLAFICGATGRGLWAGTIRGLIGLLATVGAYYLLSSDAAQRPDYGHVLSIGAAWLIAAAPVGALFGFLGALWRRGRTDFTAGAVGVLCAALVGEGIYAMTEVWATSDRVLLGLEPLLALWLPLVLLQSWRRRGIAYGVTAAGLVGSLAPLALGLVV